MKLFLSLIVLVCFTTQAQPIIFHSVSTVKGTWDQNAQKWEYTTAAVVKDITFNVQCPTIVLSDTANSTYTTTTEIIDKESNPKQFIWQATDQKNRNCTFKMEYFKTGDWYIVITYDDVIWSYHMAATTNLNINTFNH
jgi:hypothetical protein